MSDNEPITSNILDAINYLSRVVDNHIAVVEMANMPWIQRCFPKFYLRTATMFYSRKKFLEIDSFYYAKEQIEKLSPILDDLKNLYKHDPYADVGFMLDGKGDFYEAAVKARIQRYKQELKRKS